MLNFNASLNETQEVGYIEEVFHSIAYASGLPSAMPHEIILFESGEMGQVMSLEKDRVEVLIFSKNPIKIGTRVTKTNKFLHVAVGDSLLGHAIDPLGSPITKKTEFEKPKEHREVDIAPSGISTRKRISKTCDTGMTLVDLIIPIGKGQRELVIGDRKTGKTRFVMQTLLNQARAGSICIYAAIGKKKYDIKKVESFFVEHGIMDKAVIVAASSEEPAGLIYLAPYTAMTIAEYFRDQGKDVILVLDDMSSHAKFYRELALLGRRFPGRNSYPGDIFYVHAKLLERAGNFISEKGESSITAIPIVETMQGDLAGYIQTNVMSMTDGHIYFDSNLFAEGRRPAINPFLSVTRVGRQTQTSLRRDMNRELISFLTLFEKLQSFIHFGAELSDTAKNTIKMGTKILVFFDQTTYGVIPTSLQVVLFSLLWIGVWEHKAEEDMKKDMEKIIDTYRTNAQVSHYIDTSANKAKTFNELLQILRQTANKLLKEAGIELVTTPEA